MPKTMNSNDESKYFFAQLHGNSPRKGEDSRYFSSASQPVKRSLDDSKYFFQTQSKKTLDNNISKEKLPFEKLSLILEKADLDSVDSFSNKEKLNHLGSFQVSLEDELDDFDVQKSNKTLLARQREIDDAEQEAKKVLEEAQKRAQSIRRQLEEEISEAEAKRRQLSKTIVEDTVAQANEKAQILIEEANKKAEAIVAEAENKADNVLKNAVKKGYEKGFEEGRQKGFEAGKADGMRSGYEKGHIEGIEAGQKEIAKKIAQTTHEVKDIIIAAEQKRDDIVESSKDKMVEIIIAVANKVVNKELEENPFTILQIVKEATQKVSDQPRIFINVSPSNYELVNGAQNELKKLLGSKQEISVLADASFGPADVVVGTGGSGDVDARLETQLNEIRKTIESVIKQ